MHATKCTFHLRGEDILPGLVLRVGALVGVESWVQCCGPESPQRDRKFKSGCVFLSYQPPVDQRGSRQLYKFKSVVCSSEADMNVCVHM